ncbi:MAG: Gfo/Idh/MocA family oxidoreductase [Deltaproteobacteria bacterium]|jgi:predicted dehydrogenase|nr:Gfo/Idh/MocA family oxidoreductase [Deltaproteobacteria bacterium]
MKTTKRILLVGTGNIAKDYAKILLSLGEPFIAVGRGESNCSKFNRVTGCESIPGGILAYLANHDDSFERAIVATPAETLWQVTKVVLECGISEILLEKPGGLNRAELAAMETMAQKMNARIAIAYNRRFYSSVIKAAELIEADGGVKSFNFEFTEWEHIVVKANLPAKTLANWLLCNSTHVIDLAFHLGGQPETWKAFATRNCSWCPGYANYGGAGISNSGASFSYQANWMAPGRWGVEWLTDHHRLILRPLEQLHIQKKVSVAVEKMELDDDDDIRFKPGLYKQLKAFLYGEGAFRLKRLSEQVDDLAVYERIAGQTFE